MLQFFSQRIPAFKGSCAIADWIFITGWRPKHKTLRILTSGQVQSGEGLFEGNPLAGGNLLVASSSSSLRQPSSRLILPCLDFALSSISIRADVLLKANPVQHIPALAGIQPPDLSQGAITPGFASCKGLEFAHSSEQ